MNDKKKLKLDRTVEEREYARNTKNDCAKEDIARRVQIMRLKVINFLNYDDWELIFNHNVNFILTENFHGKSTIFHALSLVLGGELNGLGRGGPLRDFIKNKELPAIIRITLRNTPESSDKSNPSEDYIIIQCTISRWGNAYHRTYKLLNGKDHIESVDISASDLRKKIDSMRNIEWDHLVMTMSQIEPMKLSTIGPKKFYEDLMTAAGVRPIEDDGFIKMKRLEIIQKEKKLRSLINKINEIEESIKMLESTKADRQKLEDLKKQLQRSMVNDLKKKQDSTDRLKAERKKRKEFVRKKKKSIMKLQKSLQKAANDIKALDDLGSRVASNKRELATKIKEKKKLRKETAKMKNDRDSCKQKMKKFALADIEAKLKEQEERKVTHSGELERLDGILKQLKEELQRSVKGMEEKRSELDRLQTMHNNPETISESIMSELLNAVEKYERSSERQPCGPSDNYYHMTGSSDTLVANCSTEQIRIHLTDNRWEKTNEHSFMAAILGHYLITQLDSCNKKREEINSELDEIKDKIKNYKSSKQKIIHSMDVTNDNIPLPNTLEELNVTIQDLEKKIADNATKKKELKKAKKKLKADIDDDEIKIHDTSYHKLNGNWNKRECLIATQRTELAEARKACNLIDKKLQRFQKNIENLEADMEKENFTISPTVSDANTLSPDMNPQRSTVEINQEIKQVKERIAAAEQQQESNKIEMMAELEKKSKERDELEKSYRDMKAEQEKHKQETLTLRNKMEQATFETMQEEFGRLVAIGGLPNYPIVDSEKKELQVPRNSFGGKKEAKQYFNIPDSEHLSYYILAFILAFWTCCEDAAFYIIDNIKFPQESVIGKRVSENVLEHVTRHSERQFIIFNELKDARSIQADRVTYHKPPALQETPGTSSQSDK